MSVSINRVLIGGNLTRDPETRKISNDQSVANFGMAINRRFKGSDGEMKEEVTFLDVEAWGRTAELVGQYLTKGRACFVEGRLKLDEWQDKEGAKRSKIKIVAESVQFLDSGKREGGQQDTQRGPAQKPAERAPIGGGAGDDEPPYARPLIAEVWG